MVLFNSAQRNAVKKLQRCTADAKLALMWCFFCTLVSFIFFWPRFGRLQHIGDCCAVNNILYFKICEIKVLVLLRFL